MLLSYLADRRPQHSRGKSSWNRKPGRRGPALQPRPGL